jgi:hypothetical protein
VTPVHLPETREADATGTVAATYRDIRVVLGLPFVNLVYRYLATTPGLLERAWAELRPNLLHEATDSLASELVPFPVGTVVPIPAASLAAARFAGERAALGAATLAAYARANTRNLLAVHALLDGNSGPEVRASVEIPAPLAADDQPVLPMADLDALPPEATAILMEMSLAITGPEEPTLVPSLPRHFAQPPCLLALLWAALRPDLTNGATDAPARSLADRGRELARRLPYGVRPIEDPRARLVLGRFVRAVSKMLVVAELMCRALTEAWPPNEELQAGTASRST